MAFTRLASRIWLRSPTGRCRCYNTPSSTDAILRYKESIPIPYLWLRDNCQCPECLHPTTRQKLHRSTDVDPHIRPARNGIDYTSDGGVHITWQSGHRSQYSEDFLVRYSSPENLQTFHQDQRSVSWDVAKLQDGADLFLPYGQIKTPSGLLSAINQLTKYGLVFVTGVPTEKTSNEDCELRRLAESFGEIRKTFYGETWDVKNVRNSKNIAYTNINLDLHMDLLYFQHPPRFQILHCLRNHVRGGTSIFVDALHVASEMRKQHPDDFDTLAETLVPFHYVNDGHHLHHAHPTIELESAKSNNSDNDAPIAFINYSPPFQAPLPMDVPERFYISLKRFSDSLERGDVRFQYTLREGDAVLFDNRRILHARTSFTDSDESRSKETSIVSEDTPNRWLKGCYLEADAVLDRGRVLRKQLSQQ